MAALAHNDSPTGVLLAGCGGCLLLVVIAVIVVWVALTKTGLMPVPFPGVDASTFPPSRTVEPSGAADISKVIANAAIKSIGKEEGMEIALTEGMLTALLRQTTSAGDTVISERVQVAIQDGGPVELYVPVKINDRETVVIVHVTPKIVDGELVIDLERLQIGRLRVLLFLTANAAQKGVASLLDDQLGSVQGSLKMTNVTLTDGAITVNATIDPKALLP